jgi:hypothetical protein
MTSIDRNGMRKICCTLKESLKQLLAPTLIVPYSFRRT